MSRFYFFPSFLIVLFCSFQNVPAQAASSPYPSASSSNGVSKEILNLLNEQKLDSSFELISARSKLKNDLILVIPLSVGTDMPGTATAVSHENWGLLAQRDKSSISSSTNMPQVRRIIVLHPSLKSAVNKLFPGAQILTADNLPSSLNSLRSGAVDGIVCTETTAKLLTHFSAFSDFNFFSYPNLKAFIYLDVKDPQQANLLKNAISRNSEFIYRSIYEKWQLIALTDTLSSENHNLPFMFTGIFLIITVAMTFTVTHLYRNRRDANLELDNAVKFWESLIQSIPTPTLVLTPDGIITHINGALVKALRSSERELNGLMLHELSCQYQISPPLDTRLVVASITNPHASMAESTLKVHGRSFDILRWLSVVYDTSMTPRAIVIGWIDITDRRKLEKDLAHALNKTSKISDEKTLFLSRMSHELRSPLNVISGVLESVTRNSTLVDSLVPIAVNAANQLLDTVGQILDLSKIEAGELNLHPQNINLELILQELSSNYQFLAEKKSLYFNADFHEIQDKYYMVDKVRLNHILNNILSNAIKYTVAGGVHFKVSIIKDSPGTDTVSFVVKDTGIGIDSEDLPHITRPYRQLNDYAPESSGLGLSIAHQLIALMGGTMSINSTKGVGSTFTINLTLNTTSPTISESLIPVKLQYKRVLAVDDSSANLTVMTLQLEQLGHVVITSSNGKEALTILEKEKIDIVITDCQMNIMNGYDLTRAIRLSEVENDKNMLILGVTANAFSDEETKCLSVGMDGCLIKPVKTSVLQSAMQKLEYLQLIDFSEVISLAGNPVNLIMLLREMVDCTLKDIDNIRISINDIATLNQCIHKIKGTYTLTDFQSGIFLCEEFENNLNNGLSLPVFLLKLERVNYHFVRQVMQKINTILNSPESGHI